MQNAVQNPHTFCKKINSKYWKSYFSIEQSCTSISHDKCETNKEFLESLFKKCECNYSSFFATWTKLLTPGHSASFTWWPKKENTIIMTFYCHNATDRWLLRPWCRFSRQRHRSSETYYDRGKAEICIWNLILNSL